MTLHIGRFVESLGIMGPPKHVRVLVGSGPMSYTLHESIEAMALVFAHELVQVVRGARLEELGRNPPGRPRGPRSRAWKRGVPGPRRRFAERRAATLDLVVAKLSQPKYRRHGMRSEEIQRELGISREELPRAMALGLKTKRLTKRGARRSTVYEARRVR